MDYDLSFLNKTEILPNINLMGLGRLSARNADCNSWDCPDDYIYECGNCEEGDYDYNPCGYYDCAICDCDCYDYDPWGDYDWDDYDCAVCDCYDWDDCDYDWDD